MRIVVTALCIALMMVTAMSGPVGAQTTDPQALDPQALVGEWTGKWVRQTPGAVQGGRKATTTGAYRLVINKVEGRAVLADIYREGAQGASEREVRGRLEGNTLTFGPTRFTVTGKAMRGNISGPAGIEIDLTKLK